MSRRLEQRIESFVDVERVRELMSEQPDVVLVDEQYVPERRARHLVTLSVGLATGATAGHDVEVELGRCDARGAVVRLPVAWHPTAHSRVLPAFRGELSVAGARRGTVFTLAGSYEPPLGPIGALADGVLGRRIAEACVADLLARMVHHVERESIRHANRGVRPAPYPPDLRPSNYHLTETVV